jgi:uncharacterized protein
VTARADGRRPHNEPLIAAAAEGSLLLQRCRSCGHVPTFPRIACSQCLAELEWFEASGRGTVESFTVIRRPHSARFADHVPIVMALIRLEEGSELISTIVGDNPLAATVGSPVRMAADGGWSALPQFRLAPEE